MIVCYSVSIFRLYKAFHKSKNRPEDAFTEIDILVLIIDFNELIPQIDILSYPT